MDYIKNLDSSLIQQLNLMKRHNVGGSSLTDKEESQHLSRTLSSCAGVSNSDWDRLVKSFNR